MSELAEKSRSLEKQHAFQLFFKKRSHIEEIYLGASMNFITSRIFNTLDQFYFLLQNVEFTNVVIPIYGGTIMHTILISV